MTASLQPTHEAPYRGLRVLDFGQGVASPYAGYLLAANGADVIKVEPPEGDWSRRLGTTYGSHSALSAVYNRGKRSLVLDLKNPEAIAIARKLAGQADVVVEGFRPGVMDRLGVGYNALSRDNVCLIYLSISGFGQEGRTHCVPAPIPLLRGSPASSRSMSAPTGSHIVSGPRFPTSARVYTDFRRFRRRFLPAMPSALAGTSTSASRNRPQHCWVTSSRSTFSKAARLARSTCRPAATVRATVGSWSPL